MKFNFIHVGSPNIVGLGDSTIVKSILYILPLYL